ILFNIVVRALLLVTLTTSLFWLSVDGITWAVSTTDLTIYDSGLNILISALSAGIMYGCAIFIALKERERQIEKNVWQQGSLMRFAPIAAKAGAITCLVIIVTTVLLRLPEMLSSIAELAPVMDAPKGTAAAAVSAVQAVAMVVSAGALDQWNF